MIIKGLIDEDFVNYKKPSMTIMMPYCSFKCDKEYGSQICQNSELAHAFNISISIEKLIERYLNNPITKAIVFQGLEPFDSWDDLYEFCKHFRHVSKDDIIIYTGYTEKEIFQYVKQLSLIPNIIIKFGRFIPNSLHKFDTILGVELASNNQYAKIITRGEFFEYTTTNNGENKNE